MIEINFNGKSKSLLQISGDIIIISLIREYFSIPNPAYRSNTSYVSSRLYSITPSGKFEIGLLGEVIKFLTEKNYSFKVNEDVKKAYKPGILPKNLTELKIEYRDYQKKAIVSSILQGRGVVVLPTASGKTLVMAGLIETLRENINNKNALTLVLVPSIQLIEQTYKDFIDYGLKNVTKWSGNNKPDPSANIIIAGTQILLSKQTDLSILANVDIFLCDECHGIRKGNNINKIFNYIPTLYKYGFTGTMPPSKIDQWNIIGKFGPVNYEEKTITLKKQTYVSNFRIVILKIIHQNMPKVFMNYSKPAQVYQEELEFLINNERRNLVISNLALKLDQNTLIMVDRINHGLILEKLLYNLNDLNKSIYFIRGSTDIEEREQIRELLNNSSSSIIIAISKIFSTGINIPNLHNIIFGSAGKAKIKIMQSIGRALRLHPTKKIATIFDIADNTKYGKVHLQERKKLYENEKYEYQEKEI
jgi:superfamily II DNA or RNA helicase